MTTRAALPQPTSRRSTERKRAIWLLWTIAIVCVSIWGHGLFLALTVGPSEQVGVLNPGSWEDLSRAVLGHPFQALSFLVGSFRAHRLESWASSSFPLGLIAEGAIVLSLYLRKKGW